MNTGTPLEQVKQRLQQYLDAEARILQSQEYQVGGASTGRRNRRADLESVQAGIRECNAEIARLESAAQSRGRRTFRLRPY